MNEESGYEQHQVQNQPQPGDVWSKDKDLSGRQECIRIISGCQVHAVAVRKMPVFFCEL